jgi:predicted deacylase
VTPSVAILAGQSSATFTVFGLSPAGSVTITASANGTVITSHVQVVP